MIDANLPENNRQRIVIVGAGFAGLNLAFKLRKSDYQIVLLDVNNFHQFQPLFYQVAMSGLEPSSIIFPLRKIFQKNDNVHIRIGKMLSVDAGTNKIDTTIGEIAYDHLVLATGTRTNFYGLETIQERAFSLKSISESIYLRNNILINLEKALLETDPVKRKEYLSIVIVGGGPTGVELAGALAEMKKFIFPKDYKELDINEVEIHLVQAGDTLLAGMEEKSRDAALRFLEKMGVNIHLGVAVDNYDGLTAQLGNGKTISTHNLIWVAGVKPAIVEGLEEYAGRGDRLIVNEFNKVDGLDNIYAIGDLAYMETETFQNGHPQVAQVAIQQSKNLAKNFKNQAKGKTLKEFVYKNKGILATVGRNKAVADLPKFSFTGFFAWVLWLGVHLFSLIGVKNRIFVMINWIWNYISYDQSLRLIIRPYLKMKKNPSEQVIIE